MSDGELTLTLARDYVVSAQSACLYPFQGLHFSIFIVGGRDTPLVPHCVYKLDLWKEQQGRGLSAGTDWAFTSVWGLKHMGAMRMVVYFLDCSQAWQLFCNVREEPVLVS